MFYALLLWYGSHLRLVNASGNRRFHSHEVCWYFHGHIIIPQNDSSSISYLDNGEFGGGNIEGINISGQAGEGLL
jgi:hypothetical protein